MAHGGDDKECNYYQSKSHKKGKLYKCEHCERYFCEDHKEARLAGVVNFSNYNKFASQMGELSKNRNTHPCLQFNAYMEELANESNKTWGETLSALLGGKSRSKPYINKDSLSTFKPLKPEEIEEEPDAPRQPRPKPHKPEPVAGVDYSKVFYLLLIIAIIALVVWKSGYIKQQIGLGSNDENKTLSDYAFKSINDFRRTNNIQELTYNDNAYKMASNLIELTSQGEYLTDIKKAELASKFSVVNPFSFIGQLNESTGEDIRYVVSRWETLDATKEKLLNSSYKSGAISCIKDICYMVVSSSPIITANNYMKVNPVIAQPSLPPAPIKKDNLMSKCEEAFNTCIDVASKKYGIRINLIEKLKVTDNDEANEFYDTWKGPFQLGLTYSVNGYTGNKDINYPLVLFATSAIGPMGQIPVVVICTSSGDITSEGRDSLGC